MLHKLISESVKVQNANGNFEWLSQPAKGNWVTLYKYSNVFSSPTLGDLHQYLSPYSLGIHVL